MSQSIAQEVEPSKLYRFSELSKVTGKGKAGIREAVKRGLQVRYDGRHGWVLGQWYIDYVIVHGRTER